MIFRFSIALCFLPVLAQDHVLFNWAAAGITLPEPFEIIQDRTVRLTHILIINTLEDPSGLLREWQAVPEDAG
jgi:hypothetical protein